jgi:hypothetical protein
MYTIHDIQTLVQHAIGGGLGKPCLFMSFYLGGDSNLDVLDLADMVTKDVRWLPTVADVNERQKIIGALVHEGWCLVVMDSDDEVLKLFAETHGDDTGGCIYASTYDSHGALMTENT